MGVERVSSPQEQGPSLLPQGQEWKLGDWGSPAYGGYDEMWLWLGPWGTVKAQTPHWTGESFGQ